MFTNVVPGQEMELRYWHLMGIPDYVGISLYAMEVRAFFLTKKGHWNGVPHQSRHETPEELFFDIHAINVRRGILLPDPAGPVLHGIFPKKLKSDQAIGPSIEKMLFYNFGKEEKFIFTLEILYAIVTPFFPNPKPKRQSSSVTRSVCSQCGMSYKT